MNLDKSLILSKIKSHYNFIKDADFADFLGITPQVLSNWNNRNTFDIEKVYTKCLDINPDWLLTGKGEMLRMSTKEPAQSINTSTCKRIPLIAEIALNGFKNEKFNIQEADVKEYYIIPKFKHQVIDFMIEVSGSGMYPKYNSGDVVACTMIRESKFIQWNKSHVIATKEQGVLIKRVKKSTNDNSILAVSDNESYEPFEIPKNEITGIAIVVGVIRLE